MSWSHSAMNSLIDKDHETLDDLLCGYKVIQPKSKFRFSIDAVLLAHFASVKKRDICVDFCSGCGVIAFLLVAHNDISNVTCIEIQQYFADMIERSIKYNSSEDKIKVICDNLENSFKLFGYESVDVVTCNPPYLKKDTGKKSDDTALNISRREVKTDLETVVLSASKILKNKGRFAMVHLADRADEIFSLMIKYNIPVKKAQLVQPNMNSKPNLILVEGVKNAKNSIDWQETLNIYCGHEYSKAIKEIYGQAT